MNKESFESQYLQTFKVDEAILALDGRLKQYYQESEFSDNSQAARQWSEFKRWCFGRYSQDEINASKRRVTGQLKFKDETGAR